jgi:hypothetical protein
MARRSSTSGGGGCGSRIAHQDAVGALVIPREYHREDIDEDIALVDQVR